MKKTIGYFDNPLEDAPALALLGGLSIYLLAHVAFRWRNIHTLNRQRLLTSYGEARNRVRHQLVAEPAESSP
ncbi:MAG: hypothetical protein ACR2OC_10560 [Solirubrobacterales bacterium]